MSQTPADDRFCPTDGQLLSQFLAQQSQEAFAALARRHTGMVLRVCRARAGADAEDAAQAVFLTLAIKARSLTGAATVAGWLYRVAWYIAGRSAEAAAIRQRHEQEAARMRSEQTHLDSSAVPEAALHAALAALPEKHRLPLVLHHLEGRTEQETATLLGLGRSAASSRLSRAREELRKRLSKLGLAGSAAAITAAMGSQSLAGVPAGFVTAVSETAVAAAAGNAACAASTLALSKGAIHMLFMAKMKLAALVTAAVMLIGSAGLGTYLAFGAGPLASPAGPRAGRTLPVVPPATTQAGWTAFQADGIEAVRAVQVNAGRCRAVVALLPDGRSTVDASGDTEMTAEEYALHEMIQRARREERPDGITADQWKKLAAHPERLWIIPLVRESDEFLARWNPWTNQLWDTPAGKALEPITAWMKMEEGPAREAGKKELVALVREKLGAMEAVVRQKLKGETTLGSEVLSPQQRAALAAKIEKSHPRIERPAASTRPASAPARWVHLNERGDGVHGGLILLAKQGNVSLTIKQGAGLNATLPTARSTPTRGGAYAQHGLGVRPDFLGGDAYFSFEITVPADPAFKDATEEIKAGTNYPRLEKRAGGLPQLKLTPEQSARIAELRKKAPDVDQDTATALAPTQAESERLRALVSDWWQSKPTRQAAADALLAELKQLDQAKTAKVRAFHTLAHGIGATLTPEQRKLIQTAAMAPTRAPATAPVRKPAPPLLPDEL